MNRAAKKAEQDMRLYNIAMGEGMNSPANARETMSRIIGGYT